MQSAACVIEYAVFLARCIVPSNENTNFLRDRKVREEMGRGRWKGERGDRVKGVGRAVATEPRTREGDEECDVEGSASVVGRGTYANGR